MKELIKKTEKDLLFMYGFNFLTADSTKEAITIAIKITSTIFDSFIRVNTKTPMSSIFIKVLVEMLICKLLTLSFICYILTYLSTN